MSLIAEFSKVAASRRDKVALITESSQLSYAEILAMVDVLDRHVAARLDETDRTLVMAIPKAEFVIAFLLLMSLRNLTVIFSRLEDVMAAEVSFDKVVTLSPSVLVPKGRQIIVETAWFAGMEARGPSDNLAAGGNGTLVARTSGSTGTPKFVANSEYARLAHIRSGFGFHRTDLTGRRLMATLGPLTSWALSVNLGALLWGGSVVSLSDHIGAHLAYIDLYAVDTLVSTPVMLQPLLNNKDTAQYLVSLRDIRVGGSGISQHDMDQLERRTGARIHHGYGAAEIGNMLSFVYDRSRTIDGSFLGELSRDDLEIAFYTEDLTPLPPDADEGVVGFRVTDPRLRRSYLSGDSVSNGAGMIGDVFFPGDILRRDAHGYHFVGRVKHVLNFSGNKVSLDQLEVYLCRRFAGHEFCALVETGSDGLERALLIHRGTESIDAAQVHEALAVRFPHVPITRVETVSDMPRTETGKIDRAKLRAQFIATRSS